MSTKHTPGPWTFDGGKIRAEMASGKPYSIASVNGAATREGHANGQIMATAPDLLAVVEWLLAVVNVRIDDPRTAAFDAARAAIARAKGEQA